MCQNCELPFMSEPEGVIMISINPKKPVKDQVLEIRQRLEVHNVPEVAVLPFLIAATVEHCIRVLNTHPVDCRNCMSFKYTERIYKYLTESGYATIDEQLGDLFNS